MPVVYFNPPWEAHSSVKVEKRVQRLKSVIIKGSLQSLDWNGGMEQWTGIVESQIQRV